MTAPPTWLSTVAATLEKCPPEILAPLIAMAEREQRFRHRLRTFGQIFAFVIALSFMGTASMIIYSGHEIAGTIIGSVDILSLVAVFLTGKQDTSEPKKEVKPASPPAQR